MFFVHYCFLGFPQFFTYQRSLLFSVLKIYRCLLNFKLQALPCTDMEFSPICCFYYQHKFNEVGEGWTPCLCQLQSDVHEWEDLAGFFLPFLFMCQYLKVFLSSLISRSFHPGTSMSSFTVWAACQCYIVGLRLVLQGLEPLFFLFFPFFSVGHYLLINHQ